MSGDPTPQRSPLCWRGFPLESLALGAGLSFGLALDMRTSFPLVRELAKVPRTEGKAHGLQDLVQVGGSAEKSSRTSDF